MSFLRVTTGGSPVAINDLGVTLAASSTIVLTNQFSINDLYKSADLEALIIATTLAVEIDYGTGFAAVAAADYTNRDALAAFLNVYEISNENNNEDLVDGSDASALHIHDSRYFTETELSGTGGADLIGVDDSSWTVITGATVQEALDSIDDSIAGYVTLDNAYDGDSDGILDVDGATKPLNFRSNNSNDIQFSRTNGTQSQDALLFDVSANELILGADANAPLAAIDVRIKENLIVEGNLTITGTITDTTVNELNITNANIRLRDGATGISAADAYIEIERGTTGADARFLWNETLDRFQAGLVGGLQTIALLDTDEVVTGVYEFQGGASTEPNMYMTNKSAASTTNLGTSTQIPVEMVGNTLCYYDKTRTKTLSVHRQYMTFTGRDSANNANEYARIGDFTSNQAGGRLMRAATLIGISGQTNGAETWNVQVRKNGVATNLATLAISAAAGGQASNTDVDFAAGDQIQVFIDGTSVDRPLIRLEFADKIA